MTSKTTKKISKVKTAIITSVIAVIGSTGMVAEDRYHKDEELENKMYSSFEYRKIRKDLRLKMENHTFDIEHKDPQEEKDRKTMFAIIEKEVKKTGGCRVNGVLNNAKILDILKNGC